MSDKVRTRTAFVETGKFPTGSARLVELDALRGLSILLVVGYHYFTAMSKVDQVPALGWLAWVFSSGWAGVDLFFVLSGFLIGTILLENCRSETFFRDFYIRRAARLLPPYLIVVIAYAIAKPMLLDPPTWAGHWLVDGETHGLPVWVYLVYLQNLSQALLNDWGGHWLAPTWSLAVEEQFYLVAPLLIVGIPNGRLARWFGVMIIASVAYRSSAFVATGDWIPSFVMLPSRADSLLIGMLGALACRRADVRCWLAAHTGWLHAALWLALVAFAAIQGAHLVQEHWVIATAGHTVLAILSLGVILAAIFTDGWLVRFALRNRGLIFLGELSYGIYLLHQPAHGLVALATGVKVVRLTDMTDLAVALFALVLTVLLAWASAVWLERPIQALARRSRGPSRDGALQAA